VALPLSLHPAADEQPQQQQQPPGPSQPPPAHNGPSAAGAPPPPFMPGAPAAAAANGHAATPAGSSAAGGGGAPQAPGGAPPAPALGPHARAAVAAVERGLADFGSCKREWVLKAAKAVAQGFFERSHGGWGWRLLGLGWWAPRACTSDACARCRRHPWRACRVHAQAGYIHREGAVQDVDAPTSCTPTTCCRMCHAGYIHREGAFKDVDAAAADSGVVSGPLLPGLQWLQGCLHMLAAHLDLTSFRGVWTAAAAAINRWVGRRAGGGGWDRGLSSHRLVGGDGREGVTLLTS